MDKELDIMLLIHDTARAFRLASSEEELDGKWKELVSPHYHAIPKVELAILTSIHDANLTIIRGGLRHD
jgi:hypothetical protein